MRNPSDPVASNNPMNALTGQPMTDAQMARLNKLTAAGDGLYLAMHEAEGSAPPDGPFQDHHFGSRRMSVAATHLETCLMYARKAALEAP